MGRADPAHADLDPFDSEGAATIQDEVSKQLPAPVPSLHSPTTDLAGRTESPKRSDRMYARCGKNEVNQSS